MSEAKMRDKFKELNMTEDELRRLSEAMKKEEFRKLLLDYAEEISDPANRELYEREISALEAERGMNVTFIHPEPGYCVKTSQQNQDGSVKKCFINVCKNDQIGKPTCKREPTGVSWSIPHTCSPPRDDFDNSNRTQTCAVYDVVFSSDAFRMGQTNERFDRLLLDSAFESIEKNFSVKLDKVNSKRLKNVQFKGKPTACVLRKPLTEDSNPIDHADNHEDDPIGSIIDQLKQQYLKNETVNTTPKSQTKPIPKPSTSQQPAEDTGFTKPVYKMVHRGHVDMQDYAHSLSNQVESRRPKELVVSVELPLCKSSENVVLDIFEKRLFLKSESPNYLLDLALPFPINESGARAKFDKSKRCLNITLPVVPFVAKVDIINVDHLTDDEDSNSRNNDHHQTSLSPSPSSSSASSLTNESNLDAVISAQQQTNDVKYTLPNLRLFEYKNSVVAEVGIVNYNRRSIRVKFASESEIRLECESASKSGYVQYFAAHVKFVRGGNQTVEYPVIPASIVGTEYSTSKQQMNDKFMVCLVDDETFRVIINKTSGVDHSGADKRALVSLKPQLVDPNNNDPFSSLPISQEFVNTDFSAADHLNLGGRNVSRREFILNFDKIAITGGEERDEDDEEDEEEEDLKAAKNGSKLGEKVAAKGAKGETKRFVKKNCSDEEARKLEEDVLSGKCDDTDNEPSESDDDDYLEKSSENLASSFSSSVSTTNDGDSNLNSSLNQYSIKGILKKPRSVSESESGSPDVFSSADSSTPKNRHSFSGGGVLDTQSSNESTSGSKKSVSFNKQVVRNIFKPGSTIAGMKKPGSGKNKKKKQQQRKRTISDPCGDDSAPNASPPMRSRSVSDSSEDAASFLMTPIKPEPKKNPKKKKKSANSSDEKSDLQEQSKPKCALQFKNKLVSSLDD